MARTHFIGAVVLEQISGSTGSVETRQVIDGQQRLTTLQIVLSVLQQISAELGLTKFENRFGTFSRNSESFIDAEDQAYKVWPTNPDRLSYRVTMDAKDCASLDGDIARERARGGSINEQFPKARHFFAETLREWMAELPPPTESNERHSPEVVISSQLRLVAIDLEAEDDAQVIFETLNSRGADLLPGDLIKNYLFRQAQGHGLAVEKLYEDYWRDFDQEWWRVKMRQGRLNRPRFDIFLQHYLSLKTRDEVLVTHVFDAYKRFAAGAKMPTEALIKDLYDYGQVFPRLVQPHSDVRIATFLERLAIIDTATVYPFLLEAFHRYNNSQGLDELRAICCALESFLIRRMICKVTTKNYNRFFLELLSHCETVGGVSAAALISYLNKSDAETSRWPSDDDLLETFLTASIYNQLQRAKLRMVLIALDRGLESSRTEAVSLPNDLTIEHLLPVKWQKHWPIDEPEEAKRAKLGMMRDSLKHSIGNLTLLTKALNPSLSNGPWNIKRPEILAESKLNLNRVFQDVTTWSDDDIRHRSTKLAALATSIWPKVDNTEPVS